MSCAGRHGCVSIVALIACGCLAEQDYNTLCGLCAVSGAWPSASEHFWHDCAHLRWPWCQDAHVWGEDPDAGRRLPDGIPLKASPLGSAPVCASRQCSMGQNTAASACIARHADALHLGHGSAARGCTACTQNPRWNAGFRAGLPAETGLANCILLHPSGIGIIRKWSADMGILGLNTDLLEQLTFYGSYHRNKWNQALHFLFVPLILWAFSVWGCYTGPLFHVDLPSLAAHVLPDSIARSAARPPPPPHPTLPFPSYIHTRLPLQTFTVPCGRLPLLP